MDWDDVLTTEWVGEIPAPAPALALALALALAPAPAFAGVTLLCWGDVPALR